MATTYTLLFTDLEGSTRLWEQYPQAMKIALERHDALIHQAVEGQAGQVVKSTGDGLMAIFSSAREGLLAAVDAQRALRAEDWGETGPLRVRMGLHSGEVQLRGGDYFGPAVNRSARLMAAAHAGQVLLSRAAVDLLGDELPVGSSLRDLGEHHLKDLEHPERVFQLILPDLPSDFPPINSLEAFPNNLPEQLTRFVGREKELAEVERLLAETRLLTITGPGGTGKTRLELQAAAAVLEQFPQGAWLVELAPVTDPELVVQIVANILHVRETSGHSLQEALVDYLRYKSLLLILDNCEHLIAACARLADNLLHACPQLRILASSRESLGLAGEVIFPAPSLSLPSTDRLSPAELEQSEAVRLFVERAQAVSPAFCIEGENASAVAQICRRLDGIPLALELAAARVKVLSPAQIAARLDDRFRLLTSGSRTALPRQQTLKALIDWSWTLLSDSEKILLRRLAVFAGSFSLEVVEAVCTDLDPGIASGPFVSEYDLLDLLDGLVNKSLIHAGEEGGSVRYRLLETIRQYALEQLILAGELAAQRDRHLDYFAHLAKEAELQLKGARMVEWIERLDQEADNLRVAMEWGLENCQPSAISIVKCLINFWLGHSWDTEGLRWLDAALYCLPPGSLAEYEPDPSQEVLQCRADRAVLLAGVILLATNLGHSLPATQSEAEAEHWARISGDQNALGYVLAMVALARSNFEDISPEIMAIGEESLAMARQAGDIWEQCFILGFMTDAARRAGDLAAATRYEQENTRLARQNGNPWELAMSLFGALIIQEGQVNLPDIRRVTEEGIHLFTSLKNTMFVTAMRSELAHILRHQGEFDEAELIYKETIPRWLELGNQGAVAHQFECLASLAAVQGQPERAARLLGAAQDLRLRYSAERAMNERKEYEATVAEIRRYLDETILKTAWSSGEAMSLEQAIAYAVGKIEMDESLALRAADKQDV